MRPELDEMYLFRIEAPASLLKIKEEGYRVSCNTSLWLEDGVPKETTEAKKAGWDTPSACLMSAGRVGYWIDFYTAQMEQKSLPNRIICRHVRKTNRVLCEDLNAYLDGCFSNKKAIYFVFRNSIPGDIVIDPKSIEIFDPEIALWLPLLS